MKSIANRFSGTVRFGVLLLMVLFPAITAAAAQNTGAPPRDAKCPVCGMFVAKYPDWSTTLVYRDGTRRYFDGPKDLFVYYLNPAKYDPARRGADLASITVKDYYSLAPIDGRKAFFVIGSNVMGPMGKELIAFARRGDAVGFLQDHDGRRILRFDEVSSAIVKSLQ